VFVQAPATSTSAIEGTDQQFVVTALLRRRRRTRPLTDALLTRVGDTLFARQADWNMVGIRVLRNVRLSGPLVFFFELTRTHAVAAWLCRLAGQPAPAPYRLGLTPRYDAIVELRFAQEPGARALQSIRDVLEEGAVFDRPAVLGSGVQVRVFDGHSAADVSDRVNICFLVNRPPGMSRDACQAYWRTQHAQLALDNMRYMRLTRYRQVHTLAAPPPGLDDHYDGVVYAEKASFRQLLRDVTAVDTARFNNTVVVDECRFTQATPVMIMRLVRAWPQRVGH
jgi:hypothetical protein